jgi:hypothetical protein
MKKLKNVVGQMPMWGDYAKTQASWRPTPVSQLPSWAGAKRICVDLETYDPQLPELGPGVRRGGYIVGVSFKIEDGPGFYLPVRHPEDNLDPVHVWDYLRTRPRCSRATSSGPTSQYDLDYLWEQKVLFPKVAATRTSRSPTR